MSKQMLNSHTKLAAAFEEAHQQGREPSLTVFKGILGFDVSEFLLRGPNQLALSRMFPHESKFLARSPEDRERAV